MLLNYKRKARRREQFMYQPSAQDLRTNRQNNTNSSHENPRRERYVQDRRNQRIIEFGDEGTAVTDVTSSEW
jgi:hypothetical protein